MKKICFLLSLLPLEAFCQNTGIGTASPAAALHVKTLADTSLLLLDASAAQTLQQPFIRLSKAGTTLFEINSNGQTNVFMGVNAGRYVTSAFGTLLIGRNSGESLNTGINNVGMGMNTLSRINTGAANTAVGYFAGSGGNGSNNTAIGSSALAYNVGNMNTAVGSNAMYYTNASGNRNVSVGFEALRGSTSVANNSGAGNTAIGTQAMLSNTTGFSNAVVGNDALRNNTTGPYNSAIGVAALFTNITGGFNTAVGTYALHENNNNFNTAVGYRSLLSTTSSQFNTAIGHQTGDSYDNGYNNVFVGANNDAIAAGLYNVVALGQGIAIGASSVTRIGNAATVSTGGFTNWTNISDGRFKTNVQENVPGLSFISKLRPVTYNLQAAALDSFMHRFLKKDISKEAIALQANALTEKEQVLYSGFVAQEVESASKSSGFNFSGVDVPKNDREVYGLRYAEFVVPLVKAVQELSAKNEQLEQAMKELQQQVKALQDERNKE